MGRDKGRSSGGWVGAIAHVVGEALDGGPQAGAQGAVGEDFVERLVRIALDNHAGEAQHLRTLVELGDVGALARIAHDLKGIGGNLCATELSRQATATMKAARTGAPETPALALSLADALDRLLAALHEGKPN